MAKPTEVPGIEPDTRIRVAAPLVLRARLADLNRHAPAVAGPAGPDPDAVHDMRVAARRLRAALAVLGRGRLRALGDEVKALQDALGEVRDLHVQLEWATQAGEGAAPLREALASALPRAERRLARALRGWSRTAPALEAALADAAGARKGRLGGKRVAREVLEALARVERRRPAARGDDPAAAHALRIAAKKLRYVLEVAAPGRPAAAARLLPRLAALQETLGALHDADVRLERLEALGQADARVAHGVRDERKRLAAELREALRRWEADGVAAAARAGFGRQPPGGAGERGRSAGMTDGAGHRAQRQPGGARMASPGRKAAWASPATKSTSSGTTR